MRKNYFKYLMPILAISFLSFIVYSAIPLLESFDEMDEQINIAQNKGNSEKIGIIINKNYIIEQVGRQSNPYSIILVKNQTYKIYKGKGVISSVDTLYLSDIIAPKSLANGSRIYCDSDNKPRQCFYGRKTNSSEI